ncbi:MAG: hypothetical protein PQJ44_00270 [Sphaerochaetaceae bacterium]|nr:hypothetical protein [Sphaerochaetaceae bacterium]
MTTGEKLIEELNLSQYKNVVVSFVIGSTPSIFVVYYDSLRPNMPISRTYLDTYSNIVFYKRGRELKISTPFDLRRSNSNFNGTIVTYDIAMSGRTKKHESTTIDIDRLKENKLEKIYVGKLNELTVYDLKNQGDTLTTQQLSWKQDRDKIMGKGVNLLKLIDTFINEADNSVTFAFITPSTEYKDIDSLNHDPDIYNKPKKRVLPLSPGKRPLIGNSEKKYEIQLKILDFFDWLNVFEGEEVNKKDLKELLQVADIALWNTAPFFYWGGVAYNLSQLDACVIDVSIPNNTWKKRMDGQDYFSDKHIALLLKQIDFLLNPMASQLTRKLRDRGLI